MGVLSVETTGSLVGVTKYACKSRSTDLSTVRLSTEWITESATAVSLSSEELLYTPVSNESLVKFNQN